MALHPNLWVVSQDQNTSDNVHIFPLFQPQSLSLCQPFIPTRIIPANNPEHSEVDQPCEAPDQQNPSKKHSDARRRWDTTEQKILYQRCGSMRSFSGNLPSLPSQSKRSGMRSMRIPLSKKYFLTKSKCCVRCRFPCMCSASSGYGRRIRGHGAVSISFRIPQERSGSTGQRGT